MPQQQDPSAISKKVHQFITESKVDDIVNNIRQKLQSENGGSMPALSDVIDDNGNQYVNYIQQGGGVLGVALVGYTYVLEKLGVRFLKAAGTSAGAINTLMLAAIDTENYKDKNGQPLGYNTQSQAVLHEMLSFNFWDLVDGNPLAKTIIRNYLKSTNYVNNIFSHARLVTVAAIALSFIACMFYIPPFNNWLQAYPALKTATAIAAVVAVLLFLFMVIVFLIARNMVKKFGASNYGINTGNNFTNWITAILQRNGIKDTAELEQKMKDRMPALKLRTDTHRERSEHQEDNTTNFAGTRVKFITSDIINQTKVDFPDDAVNYWLNPQQENPAKYVRASMAIPVFFEPLIVDIDPVIKQRAKELEEKELRTDVSEIYFVDGGTLSNFPINAFYNPDVIIPRMPTFGAKLEDSDHIKPDVITDRKLKFGTFAGNILNTIRGYYDKDFILRNKIYKRGISYIDVCGHNWLNFSISEKEQMQLFIKGAKAAEVFFLGGQIWDKGVPRFFNKYNWLEFRDARTQLLRGETVTAAAPATATPYSLSLAEEMQQMDPKAQAKQ